MSRAHPQTTVIVCERTGYWARSLREHVQDCGGSIKETRSLPDARKEVLGGPANLLAVEATLENLLRVSNLLCELCQIHHVSSLVLADRSLARYEWTLREFGAAHVICSPRGINSATRFICNYLKSHPSQPEPLSLTERIRRRFPW